MNLQFERDSSDDYCLDYSFGSPPVGEQRFTYIHSSDSDSAQVIHDTQIDLAHFDRLRKAEQFCDFSVRAGDNVMPVHKCLVAIRSKYFHVLLSNDTKENRDGFIVFRDVNSDSVVMCVDFMYSGKFPTGNYDPIDLLHVAKMLRLQKLCNFITTTLKNMVDCNTLFPIRQVAIFYSCNHLLRMCNRFAINRFHEFMASDGFKEIDVEYLEELLSSKHLRVFEDMKCKAILNWMSHNNNRADNIYRLMSRINITNVELSYRKYLLNEPLIFQSPECLEFISKSICDNMDEKASACSDKYSAAIIMANKHSHCLERYDLEKKSWTLMQDCVEIVDYDHKYSMVLVDYHLYVVNHTCNAIHRIKITDSTSSWERLDSPAVAFRLFDGPIVALNKEIYLATHRRASRRILQYDSVDDCFGVTPWKKLRTCHSSIAVARGLVFIIGGHEVVKDMCPQYSRKVECFDPDSATWSSPVNDVYTYFVDAPTCTHNDAIYVFKPESTEWNYCHHVEVLYPRFSSWNIVILPRCIQGKIACHSIVGKIYLVGADLDGESECLSGYNIENDTSTLATLGDIDTHHKFQSVAIVM